MITYLSYPTSSDINDVIDPELCTVQYTSFDSVVDMIPTLRKWVNLEKMDIKRASRLIPVFLGDFDLPDFSGAGLYYLDN